MCGNSKKGALSQKVQVKLLYSITSIRMDINKRETVTVRGQTASGWV